MATYRNGTDGQMNGDYSYNGRRRPKIGTGMAEEGAKQVEGSAPGSYRARMNKRMQQRRKEMGY